MLGRIRYGSIIRPPSPLPPPPPPPHYPYHIPPHLTPPHPTQLVPTPTPDRLHAPSALCTAKALLSRGGANDHLLKASSFDVQALLEPFASRLAQMNTARMASRVWDGLFGSAPSRARAGGAGVVGVGDEWMQSPGGAFSADVWTTAGECAVCSVTADGFVWLDTFAGSASSLTKCYNHNVSYILYVFGCRIGSTGTSSIPGVVCQPSALYTVCVAPGSRSPPPSGPRRTKTICHPHARCTFFVSQTLPPPPPLPSWFFFPFTMASDLAQEKHSLSGCAVLPRRSCWSATLE